MVGTQAPTWEGRLAPIAGVVAAPPIPRALLDVALWMADYYLAPIAGCLRAVLPPGADGVLRRGPDGTFTIAEPPSGEVRRLVCRAREGATAPGRRGAILDGLRAMGGSAPVADLARALSTTAATLRRLAESGLVDIAEEGVARSSLAWFGEIPGGAASAPPLTDEQRDALREIERLLDGERGGLLLHGVTGSGKTEVYLGAVAAAIARGGRAIVLVPEIALTPQLMARVRGRFGDRVAARHSGLALGERAAEDRRIRAGEVDVVLGARSAVFAPVPDLRVIVVDEEHDASYKQDQTPRYDARQVAYRRAQAEGALVVYGSATPRPESWRALPRRSLTRRADGARLPEIRVVDMRLQPAGPVSRPLANALQQAADRGEKAILLLNRRGFARLALCRACGWIGRCPDCEVAMVLHRPDERLVCHHCGATRSVPRVCPECNATEVARQGTGTQGLESALGRVVPDIPLVRLDADRAAGRGSVGALLAEFARPGPAILLGTQMVAKGHDLPGVAVAAILEADGPLQYPDFRAEERAFSMIVQLAGRAGRRVGEDAQVIVQAWEPGASAVQLAAHHDVGGFLEVELERRQRAGFPPFGHLVRVLVEGVDGRAVVEGAERIAEQITGTGAGLRRLGPARLHTLRGRERRAMLLRAPSARTITAALAPVLDGLRPALAAAGVRVVVDVDPQDT